MQSFAELYNSRHFVPSCFWIVGPLSPVLISRYAKNHSPDDFCLRHYAFYIMHSTLFCPAPSHRVEFYLQIKCDNILGG